MNQDVHLKIGAVSRRRFQHAGLFLIPVVYAGAFLAGALRYLLPLPGKKRVPRLALKVTPAELNEEKKVARVAFNDHVVYVLASEGKILAFNARCPHLSCNVRWLEEDKQFKCPCHGMTFNRAGGFIEGPTRKNLSPQQFEMKDGKIILIDEEGGA